MKSLIRYFNSLCQERRALFLSQSGLTEGYLRKACSTGQSLNPVYCVAIERATGGAVTRRDLRPDDWQDIWPELAEE